MSKIKTLLLIMMTLSLIGFNPTQSIAKTATKYVPKAAEWLAVYINSQVLGAGLDNMRIQAQVVDDYEVAIRAFYDPLAFTEADAKSIVDVAFGFGVRYATARRFKVKITTEYRPILARQDKASQLKSLLLVD